MPGSIPGVSLWSASCEIDPGHYDAAPCCVRVGAAIRFAGGPSAITVEMPMRAKQNIPKYTDIVAAVTGQTKRKAPKILGSSCRGPRNPAIACHASGHANRPLTQTLYAWDSGWAWHSEIKSHMGRTFRPLHACSRASQSSATGPRSRVARVRAEYPNQLDYSGF